MVQDKTVDRQQATVIHSLQQQPPLSQTHKLLRNAFFNSFSWVASVVVNLVMVPLLIHFLGVEGFGIFSLLTGLFGYFSLLDLGLAQGVVKYVAHYTGLKDTRSTSLAISSALIIQTTLGALGTIALWVFNNELIRLLNISESYRSAASSALYLSSVGFFVTMIMGTFTSTLMGVQRFDVVGKITLWFSIITTAVTALILLIGGGLFEVILATFVLNIGALAVFIYAAHRLIPGMSIQPGLNFGFLKDMFGFTKYTFLSQVSGFLYTTLVRFVIGVLRGPEAVAYFVVPLKLVTALQGAFGSLVNVLFPFASEQTAQGKIAELREVYFKSSRYFLAISLPLYFLLFGFAREILSVWVGVQFASTAWPVLALLAIAFWFSAWSMIPSNVVTGMGHARITGFFSLTVSSLSLVLVALLVPIYESVGAAVGLLIVPFVVAPVFVWYVTAKILNISMRDYARRVVFPCIAPCAIFALEVVALIIASRFLPTQPTALWLIVACGLLFPYFLVARKLNVVSMPDFLTALSLR